MKAEDKELKNDNFNSIHNHSERGVSVLGWIVACFLLVAVVLLSALNYAENSEQSNIVKDLKKSRLLHDAYEWDQLNKEIEQCRASSAK